MEYMISSRRFLPSISSLRALEALDRLGSATAVANELSLTQSAVSRQLQALEQQVGIELFMREGRRLTLTPSAEKYATDIRQALDRIAQATLHLQVAPVGGTLNLAILPTFGMRWLVPRLPEFARLNPDVTINMNTRLNSVNFDREPFDTAIQYGNGGWPGTEQLLLRHEQVIPVCAPALVDGRKPDSITDILKLPLLHIQTRPDAWREWFQAVGVGARQPVVGHDA